MEKARPLSIGDVLAGRFLLERSLGIGGMAQVFRAVDQLLEKTCAIKAMHASLAADALLVERFIREGRAIARIQSPHVVTIMDASTSESGIPFIVMEYLEGLDLARLESARGRLPVEDVLTYLGQACTGLEAAHRLGIVHRDVKPQNIFVQERDGKEIVRLVDFGLARIGSGGEGRDASVVPRLTVMGAVIGTVSYLAPEQVRSSHDADARTDVWAIGVCLYRLLTGVVPFRGDNEAQVMSRILSDEPEPIAMYRAGAQPTLQSIVSKCLAKSPSARFGSAAELAAALAQSGEIATNAAFAPTLQLQLPPSLPAPVSVPAPVSAPPASRLEAQPIHVIDAPSSFPSPSAPTAKVPIAPPGARSPEVVPQVTAGAGLRADHKLLIMALAIVVLIGGCMALSRRSHKSGPDKLEATTEATAASGEATASSPRPAAQPQEAPHRALSSPQLR